MLTGKGVSLAWGLSPELGFEEEAFIRLGGEGKREGNNMGKSLE